MRQPLVILDDVSLYVSAEEPYVESNGEFVETFDVEVPCDYSPYVYHVTVLRVDGDIVYMGECINVRDPGLVAEAVRTYVNS